VDEALDRVADLTRVVQREDMVRIVKDDEIGLGDPRGHVDRVLDGEDRVQTIAHYLVSVSKGWKDQRRNDLPLHRDVNRNDWIDLVLALYVGSGDFVISDDRPHGVVFADLGVRIVKASDL